MELRPYQLKAVEAVESAFKDVDSTLISLATGCGKTIVFSTVAKREVSRGGRVLILAHRGELLDQAIDKLFKSTGIVAGLEKADVTADVFDEPPYTVIVASVQSMCRPKRLARFSADEFTMVIIDECHHALTDTYGAVIDHFPNAKLLGVTATPDRGDMRSLGEVFQSISYEYSIVDAIRDGYLVPIRAQTIPLHIDLSGVSKTAGDYQVAGIAAALEPYLQQICREILVRAEDRKTIVFTPLIATSRHMLDLLKSLGAKEVREVNGESEDRKETLEWFSRSGKGSILLNSMLLTEGFDEPSVDCIVVLRATKVRALYTQMVGRGTRLSPSTNKENLLLLDFLWLTAVHDLCRPACLITDDPDVQNVITEKQESSTDIDLTPEELELAQRKTVEKREEALAKRLEELKKKKGSLIDPLQYAFSIKDLNLSGYQPLTDHDAAKPTMDQIDKLEKLGFGCPDSLGAADLLIKTYEERAEANLASPKQIRLLERYGFRNVGSWSAESARKMIVRLTINSWRTPKGVNPETYQP